MEERIKNKMQEIIEFILAKPTNECNFYDYEILKNEFGRLKTAEMSAESNKKLAEMLTTMWKT